MKQWVVLAAALVVAGCAGGRSGKPAPVLMGTPGHTGAVTPLEYDSMQDRVAAAVNDLAARLRVAPDAIRVVSARSVSWSSSAVGCPRPDVMYATVITPAYEIVLAANGTTYHYHGGEAGEPFLCAEERREAPAG
jgi:hypothetical protein